VLRDQYLGIPEVVCLPSEDQLSEAMIYFVTTSSSTKGFLLAAESTLAMSSRLLPLVSVKPNQLYPAITMSDKPQSKNVPHPMFLIM
jgi:hypothetical protein